MSRVPWSKLFFVVVAFLLLIAGLFVFYRHQVPAASTAQLPSRDVLPASHPLPVAEVDDVGQRVGGGGRSREATARDDPAELIKRLQAAFSSPRLEGLELALTKLLPLLVQQNPTAAAHLAESIQDEDLRAEVLSRVGQLWAARDPLTALRWADGLKADSEREAVLAQASRQIAGSDPALAVHLHAQFLHDEFPNSALENLTQLWAERNFNEALDWTSSRAEGAQREQLLARLAYVKAQNAPSEAAQLVLEKIPPGEARDEAAMSVLHVWAQRDWPAASAWVEHFPSEAVRLRARKEFAGMQAASNAAPGR